MWKYDFFSLFRLSLIANIGQLKNLLRNVIAMVINCIQPIQVRIRNRYYVLDYVVDFTEKNMGE